MALFGGFWREKSATPNNGVGAPPPAHRRHMTKDQSAMSVAKISPEPGKGGRGKKTSGNIAKTAGYSHWRLQQARYILRYAPDLSDNVLTGVVSLNEAYKEARERKDAALARP